MRFEEAPAAAEAFGKSCEKLTFFSCTRCLWNALFTLWLPNLMIALDFFRWILWQMSTSSRLTLTFRTSATFNTAFSSLHTFSGMPSISREFFLVYSSSASIFSYSLSISFSCSFSRCLVAFNTFWSCSLYLSAAFSASLAFLSSVSCCLKVFSSESSLDRFLIDFRRSFCIACLRGPAGLLSVPLHPRLRSLWTPCWLV